MLDPGNRGVVSPGELQLMVVIEKTDLKLVMLLDTVKTFLLLVFLEVSQNNLKRFSQAACVTTSKLPKHWISAAGTAGISKKGIKTPSSHGPVLSASATWHSCSRAGETVQWWRHEEQCGDLLQTQHLWLRRWERNTWRPRPMEWTCILGSFLGQLTYQLFTRFLLHSFYDKKRTKRFLLLCPARSDMTITVQALVQLIQQVHWHCCKPPPYFVTTLCKSHIIRNKCLETFPWTPSSCSALRIPGNWAWHGNKREDTLGNGGSSACASLFFSKCVIIFTWFCCALCVHFSCPDSSCSVQWLSSTFSFYGIYNNGEPISS